MVLESSFVLFLISAASVFSLGQCCESIDTALCQTGIPYKKTVFPNLPGHIFEGGASVAVEQFKPLIEGNCSVHVRQFVCRVFIPECGSNGKPVPPSWEMCQDVFKGCGEKWIKLNGIPWPFTLNCSKFEQSTLTNLKNLAKDNSTFWFGTKLIFLCNATKSSLACLLNPSPNKTDSIVSRLDGKMDVSTVDRLMEIRYKYNAGHFFSCNNNYSMPGGSFDVDPMSTDVHRPWEVRDKPTIKWMSEPSDLFTLVLYDAGFQQLNALYVNIKGNNISTSDTMKEYDGPLNPTGLVNPYVFLLYKQNGSIPTTNNTKDDLVNNTFQTLGRYGELKSISWVRIQEDPFSVQKVKEKLKANNCPILVSQAMQHQIRPFLPHDLNLTMSLNITYTSGAQKFTSCCKTFNYKETSLNVNPIGNMTMKTAHVISTPTVTFSKQAVYPDVNKFSESELYTLFMVDADAETNGNTTHPYIHWMVQNIANGSVLEGITEDGYKGPDSNPPKRTHTYYFLLYSQESKLEVKSVKEYTKSHSRYFFDIKRFVSDKNITLVGASWFVAGKDDYIRHINIDDNDLDEATECSGQPGYAEHCSDYPEEIIG